MRFTEEQVRAALQRPERDVRFNALRYFADSYARNPAIMADAIEVIERLGSYEAFTYTHPIAELPQTPESIAWAMLRWRNPGEKSSLYFKGHLERLFCRADPLLLRPHLSAILELPGLSLTNAAQIRRRDELVAIPSDVLWKRLEESCARCVAQPNDKFTLAEAEDIAEALGRDASQADRATERLQQKIDPQIEPAEAWMENFLVQIVGEMRHEPAIPGIIEKFYIDADFLSEDCATALKKIGSDAVVHAVRDAYLEAPWHFQLYSAEVFENIHSDLAVATGLELLALQPDEELKAWLATALVYQFSTEAIDAGRTVLLEEAPHSADLKYGLIDACEMMNYDIPELAPWKRDRARPVYRNSNPGFQSTLFDVGAGRRLTDRRQAEPDLSQVTSKSKIRRNDPCPCGSGKKFKKCCLNKAITSE